MNTPTTKPERVLDRFRRWRTPVLHWRPGVAIIAVGFALAFDPLVVVGVAVLAIAAGLHFLARRTTNRGAPSPQDRSQTR